MDITRFANGYHKRVLLHWISQEFALGYHINGYTDHSDVAINLVFGGKRVGLLQLFGFGGLFYFLAGKNNCYVVFVAALKINFSFFLHKSFVDYLQCCCLIYNVWI